jgi:hypothetical protein
MVDRKLALDERLHGSKGERINQSAGDAGLQGDVLGRDAARSGGKLCACECRSVPFPPCTYLGTPLLGLVICRILWCRSGEERSSRTQQSRREHCNKNEIKKKESREDQEPDGVCGRGRYSTADIKYRVVSARLPMVRAGERERLSGHESI